MKAVDLFSGIGGFTLGAELAGVDVVWAANHWPLAVRAHAANHPAAHHECQDLRQADWTSLPAFELLLAAPACQGHSAASQPRRTRHHDALRATAWAVVDCADATEPRAIVVENVPSFRRWRLYPQWRAALVALGYLVTEQLVTASAHEVPQRRERLFVIAARRRAIHFASPALTREPAFGPCVESGATGWRPITSASPGARARILAGRARVGRRCLVQHVTGHRGISLDEPIRTITTKAHWVLVDGDSYRPLTIRELARGMGFPDSYALPTDACARDATRMVGNAVAPPVARDIVTAVAEAA